MNIKKLIGNKYTFDGKVVLTDPCYVLGHINDSPNLWMEFCNLLHNDNTDCNGCLFEINGYIIFICGTKYGDGEYPVLDEHDDIIGRLPVDAGLLSVIPKEFVDSIKEFDRHDLILEVNGGQVEGLGNGDFKVGNMKVITSEYYDELDTYDISDYEH